MHAPLLHALSVEGEGLARGTDVALSTEVHLLVLGHQHPHSDVEFTAVDQEGSLDVLLDDERGCPDLVAWTLTVLSVNEALLGAFAYVRHQLLVLVSVEHMDATSSIAAGGFQKPEVLAIVHARVDDRVRSEILEAPLRAATVEEHFEHLQLMAVWPVDDEGERVEVEDVQLVLTGQLLQVQEEAVLGGDLGVDG